MIKTNIRKDNHYVSQSYLKRWESSPDKICAYRTLVSHENVPLWEEKSIKGIAYQSHLYTQQIAGTQSDKIELWFSSEFESPAENTIQKVINNDRLTSDDWQRLVQFLAMHDVRTPARLVEHIKTSPESTSELLYKTLTELPNKLEAIKNGIEQPNLSKQSAAFPLRVTTEVKDGEEFGIFKMETAVGRASWLWVVQHLLNNTAKILHKHKWTIMCPAKGMNWFTTDKPVIRLNYYQPGQYDFKGGWGNSGSEILLPLSPEHMLYTRIGHRPPARGTRFSVEQTNLLRRLIAEHAYRYIFAKMEDADVSALVPRTVSAKLFQHEKEQWDNWHSEQCESEDYLLTRV